LGRLAEIPGAAHALRFRLARRGGLWSFEKGRLQKEANRCALLREAEGIGFRELRLNFTLCVRNCVVWLTKEWVNRQSDAQLLEAYSEGRSEAAFAELVRRHLDFVYSTALRRVCDPHLAQDVAQAVFISLAKSAGQLKTRAVLCGWLHRTTQNIGAHTVRTIERRRTREKHAVAIAQLVSGEADDWSEIAPHLDTVMGELSEPDRDLLFLRYFERKSVRDVALLLGISDEAAQKRVNRAVERLRNLFIKRGVTAGAGGLLAAIGTNAAQAAPIGLHLLICAAANLPATSLATITANTIAMSSFQKSIVGTAIALLAAGGIYQTHHVMQLREQVQALQQRQEPLTHQLEELQHERGNISEQLSAMRADNERLKAEAAEFNQWRTGLYNARQNHSSPDQLNGKLVQNPATLGGPPEENIGRELGEAVLRGDPGAFEKLTGLARDCYAGIATNKSGLNDTQLGILSRNVFAPLRSAFNVIEGAAIQNDPTAIDAVVRSLLIPELRDNGVKILGILAGNGNSDALDALLNENYGFLLSTTVSALRPAAEAGNQKAIDTLAAVVGDSKNKPLWLMAANGLTKAAGSGNSTAIAALIGLSRGTNSDLKATAARGLEGAADLQNPAAIEALRSLGLR
jgi:RNA polymerase sigma factor (sigma-70 family)